MMNYLFAISLTSFASVILCFPFKYSEGFFLDRCVNQCDVKLWHRCIYFFIIPIIYFNMIDVARWVAT